MKFQPTIFASKSHLKSQWPLNNRIMVYKSAMKNIMDKKLKTNDFCIVIVQKFTQGQWSDQIFYVPNNAPLNYLHKKIVGNSKQSFFFYTPKTHIQINPCKLFKQIYDDFRDRDDNIIYLELRSMQIFGYHQKLRN